MILYEIMYILPADLEKAPDIHKKILNILTHDKTGKVVADKDFGIREFSYPIQKTKQGSYHLLIVETATNNIAELRNYVNLTKDIYRILIINTTKHKKYEQSLEFAKTELKDEDFMRVRGSYYRITQSDKRRPANFRPRTNPETTPEEPKVKEEKAEEQEVTKTEKTQKNV